MGNLDHDSSCDTVLVLGLGLALYDGTPGSAPMASSNGEYARRRLQPKQEDGQLQPSLTLALSGEATSYGVAPEERKEDDRPSCQQQVVVDYQYSSSSTLFSQHQQRQHLQYTSCHSLSLSSASTFSNSCLSSGAAAAVKRERLDVVAGHQAVAGGEEVEAEAEVDLDKALEPAPSSLAGAGIAADDVDGETAASARKKLRLTKEQSALLEDRFKEQSTLNPKQKLALAKQLNLRPRQVEVWFQNRRARTKLKQTEVDCEFLRRCCETLADENRRLHRELQELKAINFTPAATPSPQSLYLQVPVPSPATAAFTMCPGCQRISATAGTDVVNPATAKAGAGFAVAPKSAHVM